MPLHQINLGSHLKIVWNLVAQYAVEQPSIMDNYKLYEEEEYNTHHSSANPLYHSILHLVWKE